VGPPAKAIRAMGDKKVARDRMAKAGVPVIPGSDGPVDTADEAGEVAERIGYPVMLKAAHGGGGKGMRIVKDAKALPSAFELTRGESKSAFGSGELLLERALERPRHIEIQVLADRHGATVHLNERECSTQRRHQKVVEETPSPGVDAALRARMGEVAVTAAEAVGYESAGTVECLMEPSGDFYFLEMNTRLQVEHPVTEMVTGIDLVREQLRIALGEPLGWTQDDVTPRGHSIEFRVCAEDPHHDFLPSTGRVVALRLPEGPGVRVDTALYPGYTVPVHYDPLIAKLVVWAPTRALAIDRARAALNEFVLVGFPTTLPFHRWIVDHEAFRSGALHTGFIAEHWTGAAPPPSLDADAPEVRVALAALALDRRGREAAVRPGAGAAPADAWRRAQRAARLAR
jgi:acetyl-CoA carboxylase biotin carboxylase subunit